ncbi:MAG: histidine phosphatase family protein [Candidatus Thorarchaeota archaeon]
MNSKTSWDNEDWLTSSKNILRWTSTIDSNRPIMFIVRHSHRETLRDHEHMGSAGLTELGKQMSVEMGRRIPSGRTMDLYTSFVPRAYQTAEGIAEGYSEIGGEVVDINLLPSLVSPQILNPDIWERLHPDGKNITDYVNQWINGEFEGYIEPFEDFRTRFMGETVKRLVGAEEKTVYVCTTHDFTLMSAKRMILERDLVYEDREPYLGGLGLVNTDAGVEVFIGSANSSSSIGRQ